MNRFTDLSRAVRDEIADERRAKETAVERAAREAQQKRQAEAALLTDAVVPLLSEIREGLAADDIKAEVNLRGGANPAAVLEVGGRLATFGEEDETTFIVGTPAVCAVTTAGGAFVVEITIKDRGEDVQTATRDELEDVLVKAVRKLLRHHHQPFDR